MAHFEHHSVFCLPREDAPALVMAIFHARMDLMTRLADRLNNENQSIKTRVPCCFTNSM
jgi:hypothetical protein